MSSNPIYFAPQRVPLVDPKTGLMARPWYLFFQALFDRSGGSSAQSVDDVLQGVPEGIGSAELLAIEETARQASALSQPAPGLLERLTELERRVVSLEQGVVL